MSGSLPELPPLLGFFVVGVSILGLIPLQLKGRSDLLLSLGQCINGPLSCALTFLPLLSYLFYRRDLLHIPIGITPNMFPDKPPRWRVAQTSPHYVPNRSHSCIRFPSTPTMSKFYDSNRGILGLSPSMDQFSEGIKGPCSKLECS